VEPKGRGKRSAQQGTVGEHNEDPFLIALADRAKAVQENFEDRQTSTADALSTLLAAVANDQQRKEEQAARGLDALSYLLVQAQGRRRFQC
jgi:type I restriction enzyme, R subunit